MEEYSIVRVVKLLEPDRHYSGSKGIERPPQVGDTGAIVHVNAPGKNYIVENVASDGCTIWLADFDEEELEQVSDMAARIETLTSKLLLVAADAEAQFGPLSAAQLNWKPGARSWSVAQCFDHLITTHSLYFPLFERLDAGLVTPSFWEKYSPLSGFFGRFLIKSLSPGNQKKMKTTAKAQPSTNEIGGDIIQRFCRHQHEIIKHLQRIPGTIDPQNLVITSPLLGVVTYTLADTFIILDVHCRRHFGQAERVMGTAGFPG